MRVGKRPFMMYLPEDDAKTLDILAEETSLSKTDIVTNSLRLYQYAHNNRNRSELDKNAKLLLSQLMAVTAICGRFDEERDPGASKDARSCS